MPTIETKFLRMTAVTLSLGGAIGCGADPGSAGPETALGSSSTSEHAGHVLETGEVRSALLATGQQTMMTDGTHNFSETYAFSYKDQVAGTWELLSLAGTNISGWDPTTRAYGCTRSSQTVIDTQSLGGLPDNGGDESGYYRSAALPGVDRVWFVNMLSGANGLRIFHSGNPCKAGGGSPLPWTSYGIVEPNLDYPHSTYDYKSDTAYVSWVAKKANGFMGLFIGRIPDTGPINYYGDSCAHLTSKNVAGPNIAVDYFGRVHVAYYNVTDAVVEQETFDPSNNTFACQNTVLGSALPPNGTCSACSGRATYSGLQSSCLRGDILPSIAVERTVSGNDNMLVTYSSRGQGSCVGKQETRIYKSTDYGATFTFELVTGCKTSIQPRVAFAHVDGADDHFGTAHVVSMYVPSGDNRLREADWKSTDSGTTWHGAYITPARDTTAPINTGNCFWGDFQGAAADVANSRFFYDWGQKLAGAPRWTTQGMSLPE